LPAHLPKLHDVTNREMATLVPLVILVFWIGIFPNPLLTRMHPSVNHVLARSSPPVPIPAPSTATDGTDPMALPAADKPPTVEETDQP